MNRHERIFTMLNEVCGAMDPAFHKRLSAALVYKNTVISIGVNRKKTHPFQKKHSKHVESIYLHAENDCLSRALRKHSAETIRRSTLYVTRIRRLTDCCDTMVSGLAKPCVGCQRAIASMGISKVCYSLDHMGYEWL